MQLSVIVPVYNVEKYLEECLESLIKQNTKYQYELICVNDGSTDNSLDILKKYESLTLKVINQENKGLSGARNTGLFYATGEYITFIDSDDFVKENYVETMLNSAYSNNSDLVVCDFDYYWGMNNTKNYTMPGLNNKYPSLDINKRAIISSMFAWNKIYKKDFFEKHGVAFVEGTLYEDIEIISFLFAQGSISYVNSSLINYRQRENSIMSSVSNRSKELIEVMDRTYKKFSLNNLIDIYKDELEYLFIEQLLIYGQFRFLMTDYYRELNIKSKNLVKKYFPYYKNNKYLKDQSLKYRMFVSFNNSITCGLFRRYLTK